MKKPVTKNLSTPEGRAIWERLERVAEYCPEWVRPWVDEQSRLYLEELHERQKRLEDQAVAYRKLREES